MQGWLKKNRRSLTARRFKRIIDFFDNQIVSTKSNILKINFKKQRQKQKKFSIIMLELKAKYRDLSIFTGKYTAIFQRCKIFFDSLQKKFYFFCKKICGNMKHFLPLCRYTK